MLVSVCAGRYVHHAHVHMRQEEMQEKKHPKKTEVLRNVKKKRVTADVRVYTTIKIA